MLFLLTFGVTSLLNDDRALEMIGDTGTVHEMFKAYSPGAAL